LSFYWDAFGIEWMVREKMVSSSFGGLQALNADTWCWAGKPWALSQAHVSCGDTWHWGCLACALGQTARMAADPGETQGSWVQRQDPVLLGLRQDPRLRGPTSRPNSLGSCNRTQCSWVYIRIQGY